MVTNMSILQIAMIALSGVILAMMLKNYKPEYSNYIGMVVSLFIFASVIVVLNMMKEEIGQISFVVGENSTYYVILFKILGITYLCEFTASICKDAGYQSIAGQVELFGKLTVLIAGMPILQALLSTIQNFIS
ncbi:MAG: SpoIIIAC/SpoIIIAD family protein [Eubacteriales bacterium]